MEGLVWEFERNPEKAPIEDDTSSIEEIMVIEDACNNEEPVVVEKEDSGSDNVLACPICYDPLTWTVGSPSYVGSKSGSNLQCKTCKKSYFGNQTHLDLVASGGSKQYDNSMPLATELFRTPVVSFLYERGRRQNFIFGGFPGPGKEFEMAKKYLKPVLGGNIVDASCGSGLFSRLFAKSGLFSQVVALDYSENMLRQSMKRGKLPRRESDLGPS
ncbi:hypothetical protein ES332_D01G150500v1 [Gossypium tomentosum]|uniref:Methyltransferase type 11 domain-containing protein n=1 Tax=Gossypium tomentosum TaxID=34277 RepID=A0A5D2M9F3_GOSTO|nr:hypothetical protein ES332_D01G150500v1 [Gossypium tomentosum]